MVTGESVIYAAGWVQIADDFNKEEAMKKIAKIQNRKRSGDAVSRRLALQALGFSVLSPLTADAELMEEFQAEKSSAHTRFLFVTDTHYLAQKENPTLMDEASAAVCRRLVQTMNQLAGTEIPQYAGGGLVDGIQGVIHGGDLIDSGDKRGKLYDQMSKTEFQRFETDFGLTGRDGLLQYPVYEIHGNHDGPQGDTIAVDGIKRRNKQRLGLGHRSTNGLHYSWDWGNVHFVNLGIVVGESGNDLQRRRYHPLGSLRFLKKDLKRMDDPDRPIVITHHIDIARYCLPYQSDEERFLKMEWHPQDVQSYYQAVQEHRVIAGLFGHTHARNVYGWDGTKSRQPFDKSRIDLFNGDNASHFAGQKQAFLYMDIGPKRMIVREIATSDAWRNYRWSDQVWGKTI
jgi:hypothetical protein